MLVFERVSVQPYWSIMVSDTCPVGGVVNVWTGFCNVDVVPSPKSHNQETAEGLKSVKVAVIGKQSVFVVNVKLKRIYLNSLKIYQSSTFVGKR